MTLYWILPAKKNSQGACSEEQWFLRADRNEASPWVQLLKRPGGPPAARASLSVPDPQGREGTGSIYMWGSGDGGSYDFGNCDGYASSMWTIYLSSAINDGRTTLYHKSCSSTLAFTFNNGRKRNPEAVWWVRARGADIHDVIPRHGDIMEGGPSFKESAPNSEGRCPLF